jgi:hypothetical protein
MTETEMEDLDREDAEIEIPEKAEVAAIIAQAEAQALEDKGRALAMLSLGFFAGPRPSELLAIERAALTLVGKETGISSKMPNATRKKRPPLSSRCWGL